ncbi:MAG: ferrous iron transport protein B [Proteiniphilum sp.]|jgi:ferrous iron transport protein B|nr:ferrous iron transport protein B [Proteiniphilum sp.]
MRLSELQTGEKAYIIKVNGSGAFRKRILEMGFVRGEEVRSILNAPLHDPIKYGIMEYEVSLRRSEAVMIEISMLREGTFYKAEPEPDVAFSTFSTVSTVSTFHAIPAFPAAADETEPSVATRHIPPSRPDGSVRTSPSPTITVALVGNPNAGKTSLFNLASGARERVGNYSGVTVNAKEGYMKHRGYRIRLIDLPGTYSLSAYTPEELFVRKHILEEKPDVIVNVVSASAPERNLYLTAELIDLGVPTVIALNMYDELQESGRTFDHEALGSMLGIPVIPTVGKRGEGIPKLLDTVIALHRGEIAGRSGQVKIPYGRVAEKSIAVMERTLAGKDLSGLKVSLRYICIKLLEGDSAIESEIGRLPRAKEIFARRDRERAYIEKLLREDPEAAFTNARYGFIAGGLKKTLGRKTNFTDRTKRIDSVVTNRYAGFPIFFLFLWLMFETTFRLGSYPMEWIEWAVRLAGNFVRGAMTDGPLKDLIVDGIIGGVGGVIVFLPNIVILYLFISFMEDSGYMARVAFIMDKVMHKIGVHGKSFIPLIMGFGCNVPAIMSTRTIESRNSRMITMLIVPFMSCSARLPVYILFVSAFFPAKGSFILLGLYATGILVAILTALLLRKKVFKKEDTPFVMELPPYRMPAPKSVLIHMWDRSRQYLGKMGGPILIASILIWFLGYFPRDGEREAQFDRQAARIETLCAQNEITVGERDRQLSALERQRSTEHQENSCIGRIGQTIEPVMRPLGFDWKISIGLLSGMAAKEIVISTMGVLYTGDGEDQQSLQERLKTEVHADGSPVFTPQVIIGFLLFVLIYFPCIATIVAIREESHSRKWALFSVLYSTGLAWLIVFLIRQIAGLPS